MSDPIEPRALDRREFLQLLGAASLASVLPLASEATAQTSAPTVAPATPAASVAPAAPAPPAPPSEDARALTALLKRRYPDRFSEAQWESIARDFDGDLGLGKRLRALKLKNSDEPDFTYQA